MPLACPVMWGLSKLGLPPEIVGSAAVLDQHNITSEKHLKFSVIIEESRTSAKTNTAFIKLEF